MTDAPGSLEAVPEVASTSVFVATFAALLGIIAGLLVLDFSLARIERVEAETHAASEYAAGLAELEHGRAQRAIDHFDAAVAIERTNVSYALGLARAEVAAGEQERAETILRGLLGRAENDGAVNLAMAEVMMRQRRPDEAQAFFHRAIFGRWGADSVERRTAARFELIGMLQALGRRRQLLAELLPLEEMPAESAAARRRLGHLFIDADSPRRAADVFRDLLRRDPDDADAYVGMGDAALGLGNFRTARADFAAAARLRPDDALIAARGALADTVLSLDPAARRIDDAERYRRALTLLARATAAARACGLVIATDSAVYATSANDMDSAADRALAKARSLVNALPASCAVRGIDRVLDAVLPRLELLQQ